jgi:hypothetical protein
LLALAAKITALVPSHANFTAKGSVTSHAIFSNAAFVGMDGHILLYHFGASLSITANHGCCFMSSARAGCNESAATAAAPLAPTKKERRQEVEVVSKVSLSSLASAACR